MNYIVNENVVYKVRSIAHPKDPSYFEKEFTSGVDCSIYILSNPFDNICVETITTTSFYKEDILIKENVSKVFKYVNGVGIKNES